MLKNLSIVAANVQHLRDPTKRLERFTHFFRHSNAHLYLLPETGCTSEADAHAWTEECRQLGGDAIVSAGNHTASYCGLVVPLRTPPRASHSHSLITPTLSHHSRCTDVLFHTADGPLHVVAIYARVQAAHRPGFFNSLAETLRLHAPNPHYLILGGDSNCVLDPGLDSTIFRRPDQGTDEFSQLATSFHLVDAFRKLYPRKPSVTNFSGDGRASRRPDRMYVGPALVGRVARFDTWSESNHHTHRSFSVSRSTQLPTTRVSTRPCDP
jgi:hypothetical protein